MINVELFTPAVLASMYHYNNVKRLYPTIEEAYI